MKVIVPIGNTPDVQSLIDTLIGMKWHAGTEIMLMTVVPRWVEFSAASIAIPTSIHEMEGLAADLRNALRHCEVSFTIREGDAKTEIINFAQDHSADLILVTSGRRVREGLVSASISQSIIADAHCPTLVARTPYDFTSDPQTGFRSVLLPVDDSTYADAAIQWLLNFRWSAATKVTLISVIEHPSASAVAQESLNERLQILAPAFGDNLSCEVLTGDTTHTIISEAHKYNADLIVIGSHARTGIHKLLLGSVSETLAEKAPCSVAVIRGIVPKDDSWRRTGVFRQPKLVEPDFMVAPNYYRPRSIDMPQRLPGGM